MASDNLLTFILKDVELFEKVITKAINSGEPEIINKEICHPDFQHVSLLFITLISGNYNGAKLLMEYGADINQSNVIIVPRCLRYQSHNRVLQPLCYWVLEYCSEESRDVLVKFMLDHGADLNNSEMLRECCNDESIIKKIEDFYKKPKKRAKPGQN